MDKASLEALANRYRVKAEKAFRNYQETGMQKYERERINAEDLEEAIRMAINAADDHSLMIYLRSSICDLAAKAEFGGDVRKDLIAIAESSCGYRRRT